jgi:formylglycine-generating enzyme required for sulfatase activity/uncharacterized caspase-like protein
MSKNWAICIGINEYYNLTPLRYAVQDAVAVRDFFLTEVDFEGVFYFSDDSPPIDTPHGPMRSEPTYANLKRFFRERFQTPFLSVGDNFWFFFAGHGELHEGHDYLMPVDVDPGNVDETALKISDITACLRNSGADNTVLLLDACRSQGRRSAVGFGGEAQPGIVTIYSCSPRQSSYEIEELEHGAFTHALLEGLRLPGANSCATVQRIDHYLCHQVPRLSQRYQKPIQTPYTAVEPLSKNCLILLPQRARLEDVQALKLEAHNAENQSDWNFAEHLWIRVLSTPGVDRDAILGLQRIALKRVQQPSAASLSGGSRHVEVLVTQSPSLVQPLYQVDHLNQPDIPPKPVVQMVNLEETESMSVSDVDHLAQPALLPKPVVQIETVDFWEENESMSASDVDPLETVDFWEENESMSASDVDPLAQPALLPKPVVQIVDFDVVTISGIEKKKEDWGWDYQIKTRSYRSTTEYWQEDLGGGVSLDLVRIPSGEVKIGANESPNEQPVHSAKLSEFWMGKYLVTQAQWGAVVTLPKIDRDLKNNSSHFKGSHRPVESINWDEAIEFCRRLSTCTGRKYRLPSETEWEYACRAGTTTAFHFGETLTSDLANYDANKDDYRPYLYRKQTTDVGGFSANGFGLYDMHGNVMEWCLDHWHYNCGGVPIDGSAWITGGNASRRLVRGGSWNCYLNDCCSANRNSYLRGIRLNGIGFRVVCDLPS